MIFGRVGDRLGRKGAFLVTVLMMGAATFAIGLLPSYRQVGIASPVIFILLRLIQGVALGGEWGGAAIYIAEHAPVQRRGYLTSWIGAAAAFGLGGALIVTLAARRTVGEPAFADWGWRIPFLASAALLAVSVWFRLKLSESPTFQRMRDAGRRSERPYVESFLRWPSLKLVLVALFAVMVAQGAVWYCTFFYAQSFLEKTVKVAPATVNTIMIVLTAVSAPLYLAFGWLSDRIGRKPVMVAGMLVFTLAIWPGFRLMTRAGNPALAAATARAPVVVTVDPADCSLQVDPVGKRQFKTSCDLLKGALTDAGVGYRNVSAARGTIARASIGATVVTSADGRALDRPGLKVLKARIAQEVTGALRASGYPAQADPAHTDAPAIFLVLLVCAIGATALYGPQAACLVELFPAPTRYPALSLPYHIGTGWIGGFLPTTAYAMSVSSGDLFRGLWYPIVATVISIVVTLVFLPETRGRDLEA